MQKCSQWVVLGNQIPRKIHIKYHAQWKLQKSANYKIQMFVTSRNWVIHGNACGASFKFIFYMNHTRFHFTKSPPTKFQTLQSNPKPSLSPLIAIAIYYNCHHISPTICRLVCQLFFYFFVVAKSLVCQLLLLLVQRQHYLVLIFLCGFANIVLRLYFANSTLFFFFLTVISTPCYDGLRWYLLCLYIYIYILCIFNLQ